MEQQAAQTDFIVVLAVDNSECSDYAFKYYAKEVHHPSHKVHIIHGCESWASVHPMDGGPSPGHVKELKEKEEKKVKDMEEKYNNLLKEHQMNGEFHVVGGKDAWHQIVNYQEKVNGQLIVMGSRGLNAVRRTIIGSVSDSVVHHAHCPVLVCKQGNHK